ncbi:MAG: response regulator [Bacteroidia bacterium]|nr:response regulator [Bacteroidia bacterium]
MKTRDELPPRTLNILLADDDKDDCLLFKEALEELPLSMHLTIVHDGDQLMKLLTREVVAQYVTPLPDVLFLDLNMPRKNGFECLCEIKQNENLKALPVIMFSTSYPRDKTYEGEMINTLLKIGAQDYIRKPNDFTQFKQVIHQALSIIAEKIS